MTCIAGRCRPIQGPILDGSKKDDEVGFLLGINAGFGAIFPGLGGGIEVGYVSRIVGLSAFLNGGYFLSAAGPDKPGTGSVGVGGKLFIGSSRHKGYFAFSYSVVKTLSWEGEGDDGMKKDYGPSILFGYEYFGNNFHVFADLGLSIAESLAGEEELTGAIITLDIGLGFHL